MQVRTGLLGGTFDPVHFGHIEIAKSFINSSFIDELWILLTPFPPHKDNGKHVDYSIRLKMLEAVFSDMERVKISTIENELPKPSYTFSTIRHLKSAYPEREFLFCLGEDSLEKFHTWKYHEEILSGVMLLAASRPGASHNKVHSYILDRTLFIEHVPFQISSSGVRKKIARKEDISGCVPEGVRNIILKEKLYT